MPAVAPDPSASWRDLQCEGCGAALRIAARERTTRCPYCTAPAVVERPVTQARVEPTFVVGFVVTEPAAREQAKRWISSTWFTPTAFREADLSDVKGIYVPAYLYSAEAHASYSASIGEHYTVTETYTDSKGKTRTRTKTKTEWRSLSGEWSAYVDDLVVTASQGLPNHELEGVEPFDLRALRRYTPKVLSGWIAEEPSLSLEHCQKLARREALNDIERRLHAHMPGNKHRDLQHQAELRHEDLELVLLPVWVLAVRYDPEQEAVRMVVNGQTGQLYGRPPRSMAKILATVIGVIALVVGAYLLLGVVG